jgi:hypothetical protein
MALQIASLAACEVSRRRSLHYYAALRRSQATLKGERPDWELWVGFFLRCLKQQKDNLQAKLGRERILAASLLPLSQEVISLLRQHGRLTISDLEQLTGANKNTLKVRLRELTGSQQISRFGRARATWYELGRGGRPQEERR